MNDASADSIRTMFASAISDMYQAEAPQYRAMKTLVAEVNRQTLADEPQLKRRLEENNELERLDVERHGAIRVGTAEELSMLRRLFAIMGMAPVGYYDLSIAGIPVHSTAFRPIGENALRASPFRIFTSLLRLDLIADAQAREIAAKVLAQRDILTPRCRALIDLFERHGFDEGEAREFVREAAKIFRWNGQATVSSSAYRMLHAAHPLLADIVCFKGPHINHLTLHALDIDAAHSAMAARGMNPKAIVEGPPRRSCPILLRQTSFKARPEPVEFIEEDDRRVTGVHAARFGEIEQRGAALTAKGRALYDRLLAEAQAAVPLTPDGANTLAFNEELARRFTAFPDDDETLRREKLAFFHYSVDPSARGGESLSPPSLDDLLRTGALRAEPIVYEDFLPVSAAGIFRSNLGERGEEELIERADRRAFEAALGAPFLDELALYEEAETCSLGASLQALGVDRAAWLQPPKTGSAPIGAAESSHN
ncbi:2-oxoadipate dioxygenase/decarboxylase HglS [Methylocystis rosea]|uniref:2-oxoadipate dioxygenase/decarboxylase n=1 Tax=Methylocystis rosea TaxID=173366 RepID=A0A3G8M0Q8_9HYPH|nr:VOC family protein [Methylocystis rosea]AZG75539.1 VOC family protein [Methylocystis rosea]